MCVLLCQVRAVLYFTLFTFRVTEGSVHAIMDFSPKQRYKGKTVKFCAPPPRKKVKMSVSAVPVNFEKSDLNNNGGLAGLYSGGRSSAVVSRQEAGQERQARRAGDLQHLLALQSRPSVEQQLRGLLAATLTGQRQTAGEEVQVEDEASFGTAASAFEAEAAGVIGQVAEQVLWCLCYFHFNYGNFNLGFRERSVVA